MQRQRPVGRVARAEVIADDHHRLGVDVAAELGLALDVDEFPPSQPRRGRDPAALAEGVATELHDGEAVHLAHGAAVGLQVDGVALDRALHALAQARGTPFLGVDRRLHVLAGHAFGALLAGVVVGLAQQVDQRARVRGHALAVAGEARGVLDDPGDPGAIERADLDAPRQGRDQPRIQGLVVRVTLDIVLEVGLDLEQLQELRVVGRQQVVQQPVAEQHDLDVERHGLGIERNRAHQRVDALQRLQLQLTRGQ